eukprot:4882248-Prymnesium_polylepis.1
MEHGWERCALKKAQRQVPEALGSRANLEGRNRADCKKGHPRRSKQIGERARGPLGTCLPQKQAYP